MRHVRIFAILLMLAAGCSPLHTEVRSSYRWAEISILAVEAPASDPWTLAPVVSAELQALGYAVVEPGAAGQDLLVRFSTQDGPDFTSDGVLVTRPKSLHVKLVDPRSQALVGVADYFLRSSEDPADGMRAALGGLHQTIRSGARAVQVPAAAPAAAPPAPVATPAVQPQAVGPPAADAAPALPTAAELVAAPPEQPRGEEPATAETVVDEEPEVRSQEQSPWVPRFKSWGFEEWGKNDDFDR